MNKTIIVDQDAGIMTITLNRPQSLNALNPQMGDELLETLAAAGGDPAVRAIILTGSGRAFCAGGDLHFIINWKGAKYEAFGLLTHRLNRIIMDIRLAPRTVIAAVNGVASGAGFSLAMACDLRVAAAEARFKQGYTSIGLVPDGGWTISVARQIGMAKAAELLLLDPVLTADETRRLGLVNYVVPAAELEARARELALIAVARPRHAFAQSKALLNHSLGYSLADQLEYERRGIMNAGQTADFAEGISAFMEKREPRFNQSEG